MCSSLSKGNSCHEAEDGYRGGSTLTKFNQDTTGGLGVQEGNLGTTRANSRLLIDELDTLFLQVP